jgi:dTMP kinase
VAQPRRDGSPAEGRYGDRDPAEGAQPRRGLFLTFEGIDGSGKTTQMHTLAERLSSEGYDVLSTVEPGGTDVGAQIRRVLLDAANQELSANAELLLYFASRAQNVDEVIVPAIEAGKIVICDRFTDSTMVYQGFARGLGEQVVAELDRIACRGLKPDLTIYIDIDLETSLGRARARNREIEGEQAVETRMDEQPAEFYRKVREGYRTLAAREPERFRVIDGRSEVEAIAAEIWEAVRPVVSQIHV